MAGNPFLIRFLGVSFIALLSLAGTSIGTFLAWASSQDKKTTTPMGQAQRPEKKPVIGARAVPAAAPMPTQPPRTIDEYMTFAQTKLKLEAAKIKQSGTAELKLTIGQDGSVKQAEIVRLNGPAILRDHIMAMVRQMGPLPPLPAATDVLVMTMPITFNYPGADLYDRFGQGRRPGR